MKKLEWSAALKEYDTERRQQQPIPDRASLSEEEEWHCRVIGGEFIRWNQRHLSDILGERIALSSMKFDPDPLIVFTSTMPGLVAAKEIVPDPPSNLVYLLHEEFQSWEKQHPVDEFRWYIHHWSYFRNMDGELLKRTKAEYPDIAPSEFRIHTCGDLWAEQAGVEGDHLWRWDGNQMELLEEAFSQKVF